MILAKVQIEDFDRFKQVFETRGAEHRRRFGSSGSQILRNELDDHEVWILFDWERDGFERFLADPDARQIMSDAGLQGPPEPVFVDAAARVAS